MFTATLILIAFVLMGLFLTLAYAAETNRYLKALVIAGLALANTFAAMLGAAYSLILLLGPEMMTQNTPPPSGSGDAVLSVWDNPELLTGLASMGPLLLTLAVIGIIILYEPFRRPIARLIPIDPPSMVHLVALEYALFLIAGSLVVAVFASLATHDPEILSAMTEASTESDLLTLAWIQALGFALMSVLGVGLFVKRNFRESLQRLGVTRYVNLKWWFATTAVALLSSIAVDYLWRLLDPEGMEAVSRISSELFEPFIAAGLLGVITVGISAGIGEELIFRGAAQVRFGIGFTAFLFAMVHTQYTVSPALLQVFVVAVMLGITRARTNTTTCMCAHATYNAILVALAVYAPDLSP